MIGDDVAGTLGPHPPHRGLGHVEEPGEIRGHQGGEVVRRVVREGLGNEDPGVVDEQVEPAEPLGGVDDAGRHVWLRDVSVDERQRLGRRQRAGGRDASRVGDHVVASFEKGARQRQTDSARGAGHDDGLGWHVRSPVSRSRIDGT